MATKKDRRARRATPEQEASSTRNIGDEIIEGLEEAIAFESGKITGAVFKAAPISARSAWVAPAPDFTAADIVGIRKQIGVSQSIFAQALNVSPETERAWEQGKFLPSGSVKRLLQIAKNHPAILLEGIEYNPAPSDAAVSAAPRSVSDRRSVRR